MYFQNQQREQIKKDNPTLKTLPEMAKKMGQIWKTMNETEKKPYAEMAINDKARYERDMKAYKEKLEREKKEREAKEKEEDDDDESDDSE